MGRLCIPVALWVAAGCGPSVITHPAPLAPDPPQTADDAAAQGALPWPLDHDHGWLQVPRRRIADVQWLPIDRTAPRGELDGRVVWANLRSGYPLPEGAAGPLAVRAAGTDLCGSSRRLPPPLRGPAAIRGQALGVQLDGQWLPEDVPCLRQLAPGYIDAAGGFLSDPELTADPPFVHAPFVGALLGDPALMAQLARLRITLVESPPSGSRAEPEATLHGLRSARRLRVLILGGNMRNRFSDIADGGLGHLSGLTELQELHVRVTDESIAHLSGLTGLRRLYLGGSSVTATGLAHLSRLSQLREFFLPRTVRSADLVQLVPLSNLPVLHLAETRVDDRGLQHLSGLTNLEELNLERTEITDPGLSHLSSLTNLRALNLEHTQVSDWGLLRLSGLANLRELNLAHTGIREPSLRHLPNMLVTDRGLEHLSHLPNLRVLNLAATGITDQGLVLLAGMTQLRQLNLESTATTNVGLAHLAGMTGLRALGLAGTDASGTGLVRLARLTQLRVLNLEASQVTDSDLMSLTVLTGLRELYLRGT